MKTGLDKLLEVPVHQVEVQKDQDRQRQKPTWFKRGQSRKNNRKRTRGRHTQYVIEYDMSVWPPKKLTKCIKHI